MSSTTTGGKTKLFDRQQDFWKNYQAGRPKYPASFYQRFYNYHATKGGSFGTVHDVGAGFGEMSLELGRRFSHVIVSDPAPQSLAIAQEQLNSTAPSASAPSSLPPQPQFSFLQERVEDSSVPPASVDAVFACNVVHWTQLERAMAVLTSQLKPGGTLFLAITGIPAFSSPPVQRAWWDLVEACLDGITARRPEVDMGFHRVCALQDSGYNCVAVPESEYEPGVLRLKLNTLGDSGAFVFAPKYSPSDDERPASAIGPRDRVEEGVEREWFFDVDSQDLRAKVAAYPFDPEPEMLERHLAELDALLEGGKCEGRWPVGIILATRRRNDV